MRTLRRIIGLAFTTVGALYGWFRFAADWIGRSTIADDASLLWKRLKPVIAFVDSQPAVWFYIVWITTIGLGLGLLLQPLWNGPHAVVSERRRNHLKAAIWKWLPFTQPAHLRPMRQRIQAIEKLLLDGVPRTAEQIGICLETAGMPTTAGYAATLLLLMRGEGVVSDSGGVWSLGKDSSVPASSETPDLITAEEAGRWLYAQGSEKVRLVLRQNVPNLWPSITESGVAYVREGAKNAPYPLYGRREEGLPWEVIDPTECDFATFEELFGLNGKPPMALAMRRQDLPVMLSHYES